MGWTASEEILEARNGFFHAAGGSFDPGAIVNRLGKPWTLQDPGVSIKPFPSGSLTHPAMGEILRLVRENNIRPADVEKVDLGGNSGMSALWPVMMVSMSFKVVDAFVIVAAYSAALPPLAVSMSGVFLPANASPE